MILAQSKDKVHIVDILTRSFEDNKSVNFIIPQDTKKLQRIKGLMEYSFDVCYSFGKVYLSNDRKGCALIVLPDKKRSTLRSIFLDLKLILFCIGLSNAKRAMRREAKIKSLQLKDPMYYLWFIGVEPGQQNKGIGSDLLGDIIEEAFSESRIICLETSTTKNLPWYEKFGFTIYHEYDFGYPLYFLKKTID